MRLFFGDGRGGFPRSTLPFLFPPSSTPGTRAVAPRVFSSDLDGDGRPDIFALGHPRSDPDAPRRLYRLRALGAGRYDKAVSTTVWVHDADAGAGVLALEPQLWWSTGPGLSARAPIRPDRGALPADPDVTMVAPSAAGHARAVLVWAENTLSLDELRATLLSDDELDEIEFEEYQTRQDILFARWEEGVGWTDPPAPSTIATSRSTSFGPSIPFSSLGTSSRCRGRRRARSR